MFTITFKGKPNPKDKTLVKIDMILFKTKYPRVSKALSIIGRLKDWDEKSQLFSTKAIECLEANNKLSDIRIKYQKVAVNWEAEGKPWSPVQWSHYFDVEQKKKDEVKVVAVQKMIEIIIKRASEKERLKNGQVVTSIETGGYYNALKNHLNIFTNQKYNKAFATYYFTDITTAFLEDFLFYLRKNGAQKGHAGEVDSYLRKFYGVFYYASKAQMPSADLNLFECVRLEMKHKKYIPKTIPIEIMQDIENLDRGLLTKKEDFYLDLFLFCFYCGGIAPIDICYLTWDCINDGILIYERMKTPKSATVPFIEKAKGIARKHKNVCYGNFVLPVFSHKHKEEWQKRDRIMRISMKVNATLKKVCQIIKYNEILIFLLKSEKSFIRLI